MRAVETVRIARTSLDVSRIGFGCARLFGGPEARGSSRLLEAALAAGIRHFDTAPAYAFGQSEEMLGSVLAGVPNVTIATKVGLSASAGQPSRLSTMYRRALRPLLGRVPLLKAALLRLASSRRGSTGEGSEATSSPLLTRLDGDHVRRSLEASLRRLRRDAVDILLVHEPDRFVLDEVACSIFSGLQREGLIKAFGLGWGRIVRNPPDFGHVAQSRYDAASPPCPRSTRIFHGVLRYASQRETGAQTVASTRIRQALDSVPGSCVVVSASSPTQIRQLASS